MAPKKSSEVCQVCKQVPFKYTCPKCQLVYCSVVCFKAHKDTSCLSEKGKPQDKPQDAPTGLDPPAISGPSSLATEANANSHLSHQMDQNESGDDEVALPDSKPLRPLTTLKWPYVPEETSYPDPLKRNDPKPLNLQQYESVATSPSIRSILASSPRLPGILRSLNELQGQTREESLMRVLGVSDAGLTFFPGARVQSDLRISDEDGEDVRKLAEAVEKIVRGERTDTLGLDWAKDTA